MVMTPEGTEPISDGVDLAQFALQARTR